MWAAVGLMLRVWSSGRSLGPLSLSDRRTALHDPPSDRLHPLSQRLSLWARDV
jgi:hypothetical protein